MLQKEVAGRSKAVTACVGISIYTHSSPVALGRNTPSCPVAEYIYFLCGEGELQRRVEVAILCVVQHIARMFVLCSERQNKRLDSPVGLLDQIADRRFYKLFMAVYICLKHAYTGALWSPPPVMYEYEWTPSHLRMRITGSCLLYRITGRL